MTGGYIYGISGGQNNRHIWSIIMALSIGRILSNLNIGQMFLTFVGSTVLYLALDRAIGLGSGVFTVEKLFSTITTVTIISVLFNGVIATVAATYIYKVMRPIKALPKGDEGEQKASDQMGDVSNDVNKASQESLSDQKELSEQQDLSYTVDLDDQEDLDEREDQWSPSSNQAEPEETEQADAELAEAEQKVEDEEEEAEQQAEDEEDTYIPIDQDEDDVEQDDQWAIEDQGVQIDLGEQADQWTLESTDQQSEQNESSSEEKPE